MSEVISAHLPLFACPACRGELSLASRHMICQRCGRTYPVQDGIPLLFEPHEASNGRDVTKIVKRFYEDNPFPNYDDLDSRESLAAKARRGGFARLLDEQIPAGSLVLEVGCGTGQLTNFLGMSWNRCVLGSDLCLNSLRLAKGFSERYSVRNGGFLQMNLFRPAFRDQVFDLVISNGVLHHTADPLGAFRSISRLVKPGGFIIIGLYNKIGRLTTDLRRHLFKLFGESLRFLDGHMRNRTYNEARKRAWFMDQYKHPQESKHTYSEVLGWFDTTGFEFLLGIPKIGLSTFMPDEQLFKPHDRGTASSRFLTELGMLLSGGKDGALFIMIGKKLPASEVVAPRGLALGACAGTR